MRVIIGCEFSQIVTKAFRKKGHEAYSCDIIPCEGGHPEWHFQEDILEVLKREEFDLGIFHPPCTYLSCAANRVWHEPGRAEKREKALQFFLSLYNVDIDKICIENPLGYINSAFRKPDQIIHPYYFGGNDLKRTCLWLKNLLPLIHCKEDELFYNKTHSKKPEPIYISPKGKKEYFTTMGNFKGKERQKKRSITFGCIATAMADQWS